MLPYVSIDRPNGSIMKILQDLRVRIKQGGRVGCVAFLPVEEEV